MEKIGEMGSNYLCGVTCSNSCGMVLMKGFVHLYRHKLDKVHDTVLRNINCKGEECADV